MIERRYFLEVHLTEHCNLGCSGCSHFSPLASPSFVAPDEMEKDLRRMAPLLNTRFASIHLMGGEPLLHPEISRLLRIARLALPGKVIELVTNGLLLANQPNSFWQACRESDIVIRPTEYPIAVDYEALALLAEQNGVRYLSYSKQGQPKSFHFLPLDPEGKQKPRSNYQACHMRSKFLLLKQGKIFRCSFAGNIEHFNAYFHQQLTLTERDVLDIGGVDSARQFYCWLDLEPDFCRYCNIAARIDSVPWRQTNHQIGEWVNMCPSERK